MACAGEGKPQTLDMGQGELAALASDLRQHSADVAVSGERIRVMGEQMDMETWVGYGTSIVEEAETISALDELLALVSDVPPDQLPPGPPVFPLDAAEEVADLIESYLVQQRIARVPPDEA